jgi:thioredoxin 1
MELKTKYTLLQKVIKRQQLNFFKKMKQIFYFTAPWCEPCQVLGPIMNQVSQQTYVEKINIDYEMDRARSANVMSVPTVVLAENGQEIRRFTGVRSYEQVMQFING